jgi:hypothetical protein
LPEKETFAERYKKTISHPSYQRQMYRNKIGVPIFLGLFMVIYPINMYLRSIYGYDGHVAAIMIIFLSLCVGMSVGEYKANKKYGDTE